VVVLTGTTPEPNSWTGSFKAALIDSGGIVLLTSTFLLHSPWWVPLCWILCSSTLAVALALARKRDQPEDYEAVNRLATAVLVIMLFVGLVSMK